MAFLDMACHATLEKRRGNVYTHPEREERSWHWARLLRRVVALAMAPCPLCRRGSLRIIAAITPESVITRIVRHLKLASVPPPIAPARFRSDTQVFEA
jgi:hypothetical protein